MKKTLSYLLVFLFVFGVCVMSVIAKGAPNEPGKNYVDKNGDGVCDNRGTGKCGNYVDNDSDGTCDNKGINKCQRNKCGCGCRNRNN